MGLENCKFSLKMPQRMQYALLEGQWLTLSKHLEHGSRSLFLKGFKRHQFLVSLQMSALMPRQLEELSVFCRWEEDGTPVVCFLDIVPLKKADAESIYLALVKCIKDKIFRLAIL